MTKTDLRQTIRIGDDLIRLVNRLERLGELPTGAADELLGRLCPWANALEDRLAAKESSANRRRGRRRANRRG